VTLIDTSAWAAFLTGSGSEADRTVADLLARRARLFTSDVVVLELMAGARSEDDIRRIGPLLQSLERCVAPGPLELERAAHLHRTLREEAGPAPSLAACLVAAVALRDGLRVVSEDPDMALLARETGLEVTGGGQEEGRRVPGRRPQSPTSSSATLPPTSPPPLVLVVESDPLALGSLVEALAVPDRRVVTASSAREARSLIAREPPEVVVMDLLLPDADGRKVLSRLRRNPGTRDCGVVIAAGAAGVRTREECFALGADEVLDEPLDVEAVAEAVDLLLARGRSVGPGPDPLDAPLTLSEIRKAMGADAGEPEGETPWTVGLVEIDIESGETGSPPDGTLLPRLLRAVISALQESLGDEDLLARWGVDQLVIVSPDRSEKELAGLLDRLARLPEAAGRLRRRVRTVGRDEDLLDAVSAMASQLLQPEEGEGASGALAGAGNRVRPRAILVEDDPITANLVLHRLERSGFAVDHHDDGARALEAILKAPPDVAILDVQLPGMDGFEILGRVREHPDTQRLPVLMFTSLGRQEHVRRGFELGADDFMTKPFSPGELLTRVLRLVRRR
jgi:DNA-binding response OmpR family regulator/predicted nucleic acid-binding protein